MFEPFRYLRVDSHTGYLWATYRLRYSVYCIEKGFLDKDDYPNRLEVDAYDSYSLHFAAIDEEDLVKGTLRLVTPTDGEKFPLEEHCALDIPVPPHTGEISRVAISKRFRRPENPTSGDAFGLTIMTQDIEEDERKRVNRLRQTIILGLYIALFQESKRVGICNWLAAMEPSLARLMARQKIHFQQVGPEVDYYGKVYPYLLRGEDFESGLARDNQALYQQFVAGL